MSNENQNRVDAIINRYTNNNLLSQYGVGETDPQALKDNALLDAVRALREYDRMPAGSARAMLHNAQLDQIGPERIAERRNSIINDIVALQDAGANDRIPTNTISLATNAPTNETTRDEMRPYRAEIAAARHRLRDEVAPTVEREQSEPQQAGQMARQAGRVAGRIVPSPAILAEARGEEEALQVVEPEPRRQLLPQYPSQQPELQARSPRDYQSDRSAADRPLTREEIREAQAGLNALGFNSGVVDGRDGQNTDAATRRFEAARGETGNQIDGNLNRDMLNAIREARASGLSSTIIGGQNANDVSASTVRSGQDQEQGQSR